MARFVLAVGLNWGLSNDPFLLNACNERALIHRHRLVLASLGRVNIPLRDTNITISHNLLQRHDVHAGRYHSGRERVAEIIQNEIQSGNGSELGAAAPVSVTEIETKSRYFGHFSFTVVLYDKDEKRLDRSIAEAFKVFASRDAVLFEERYNLLN